jgi:hypothetical protein
MEEHKENRGVRFIKILLSGFVAAFGIVVIMVLFDVIFFGDNYYFGNSYECYFKEMAKVSCGNGEFEGVKGHNTLLRKTGLPPSRE